MDKKIMIVIGIVLLLGIGVGYKSSHKSGIQPGYFEKQEAPAYGVSADKAMGSDFGKEFEERFREMYKEE